MKMLLILCVLPFLGAFAQGVADTAAAVAPHLDAVGTLFAVGGAFATSALLATTHHFDTKVTNAKLFRKAQPLITLGGAFLSPFLAAKLGVQIDPSAYSAAPASTVAAIAAAELLGILKRSVKVR
jgi:hypothetical protein